MRDRDVAKQKAIKSNNPLDLAVYKRLRNKINGEVKSAKSSYYANAFIQSNGDLRKTWQMITHVPSEKQCVCERIKTKRELSNQFSRAFQCI